MLGREASLCSSVCFPIFRVQLFFWAVIFETAMLPQNLSVLYCIVLYRSDIVGTSDHHLGFSSRLLYAHLQCPFPTLSVPVFSALGPPNRALPASGRSRRGLWRSHRTPLAVSAAPRPASGVFGASHASEGDPTRSTFSHSRVTRLQSPPAGLAVRGCDCPTAPLATCCSDGFGCR